MYRFARSPRWIVLHALMLTVIGLFVLAGIWQLHRLAEKREHIALVTARGKVPASPIGSQLDEPEEASYRRVRARGRYDVAREVVLRGRSNKGRPGNHVLTPFVISGGRAVIVDRGWVPEELGSPRAVDALPANDEVTVTGVLLPSEGRAPLTSRSRERQEVVARIDVDALSRGLPYDTLSVYLVLAQQEPSQAKLPVPVTLPPLEEGPHRVYAIQWFLFVVIAFAAYSAILRREARRRAASTGVKG